MNATEHMIAWIESSRPHYERACQLERDRKRDVSAVPYPRSHMTNLAGTALAIVTSAFLEATRGGDMLASEWSAAELLDAAKALLSWEMEQ